ncbi:unnamed protein product [Sphenostylis stenocarpa]|uniref:Uncharacterized protein n=1 Tax=Sphenostylis stenocarpa TaxID=92480 RepID=A0AA86RU33_9FABA|nr:unnamed protein product [Sphenostylis stenocarpa]
MALGPLFCAARNIVADHVRSPIVGPKSSIADTRKSHMAQQGRTLNSIYMSFKLQNQMGKHLKSLRSLILNVSFKGAKMTCDE